MKRISKEVKAIADAHVQAKKNGTFDDPKVSTKEQVFTALREGKTFSEVLNQIELRYCSVGSVVISELMNYESQAYKSNVYRGFKFLLQN